MRRLARAVTFEERHRMPWQGGSPMAEGDARAHGAASLAGRRLRGKARQVLEQLRVQFNDFHRENPPYTRIPESLRRAALAARRQGISVNALKRECGISPAQLERWRALEEAWSGPPVIVIRPRGRSRARYLCWRSICGGRICDTSRLGTSLNGKPTREWSDDISSPRDLCRGSSLATQGTPTPGPAVG